MQRRLIVNADDFGRSAGVSAGILRAHQQGIVTSTSALMAMPGIARALREAAAICPKLGIGVHLNITQAKPLLPAHQVPSLVTEDGDFLPFHRDSTLLVSVHMDELRAEWTAQVEGMYTLGTSPDHLDSHHHISYFSLPIFEVMLDIASAYRLPIRFPPAEFIPLLGGNEVRQLLRARGVAAPANCLTEFYGEDISLGQLTDIIRALPAGTHELMCHPGINDPELNATSAYSAPREKELAILTDPSLKDSLSRSGIALACFADL